MPRAWHTAARQPPHKEGEEPVTVLVTGFGPFLHKYPTNTSWSIASTLPALLPATTNNPTPIHIHVHHEPVRVAYDHVTSIVPKLLPPSNPLYPPPEIVLHIGLAAGRDFYTLEKGSHRAGYSEIPDVDGQKFYDEDVEARWPSTQYPPVLKTSFDTSDVLKRWRKYLRSSSSLLASRDPDGNEDEGEVRLSPDAGNFLCGFIYYHSLAHYYSLKEDERPVAFLHVPDLSGSEEAMERGREVAVGLIRALVESMLNKGVIDGGQTEMSTSEFQDKAIRAGTDVNFA